MFQFFNVSIFQCFHFSILLHHFHRCHHAKFGVFVDMTMEHSFSDICGNNNKIKGALCGDIDGIFPSCIGSFLAVDSYYLEKVSMEMHRVISSTIVLQSDNRHLPFFQGHQRIAVWSYLVVDRPSSFTVGSSSLVSSHYPHSSEMDRIIWFLSSQDTSIRQIFIIDNGVFLVIILGSDSIHIIPSSLKRFFSSVSITFIRFLL